MVTLETADKALKNFYLDAITRELDSKASPFLAKLEKTSANVVGKSVTKVVKLGINGGIGAGTETGDLPKGDSGEYLTFTAPLKNLYGTIEISDKALRAAANNEGAFVNILNEEMEGLVQSAKYNFSRMLFGRGDGYIGTIVSSGANTYILTKSEGIVEGMYLDVWKNGVKTHSKIKVALYEKDENKIVVEGADVGSLNIPDPGSEVRACGSEEGYELTGLSALFSDEPIYGLDRTKAYMNPYVEYINDEITEEILQYAIDMVEERGGGKVNMILCSRRVRRALTKHFKERQSFFSMTSIGDNQQVLTYNGIPIVIDSCCPEDVLYLLNTDDFKICQLCDWQWMEGEDGKILKQVAGKPVYTATLVKYAELICQKPCGQGMIGGIE